MPRFFRPRRSVASLPGSIKNAKSFAAWPEFSTALNIRGSRQVEFTPDHEMLTDSTTDLAATLSFGGFQRPLLSEPFVLHPGRAVTLMNPGAEKLTLKLRANGIFTGTFIDPVNNTPATFSGIVLPAEQIGLGFFLSGDKSGFVEIAPAH